MAAKKKRVVDSFDPTVRRNARLECLMEIFECFDFHKVQKVMEMLDWKISLRNEMSGEFECVVPSVNQLLVEARRLAEECWKAIDEDPEAQKTGECFIGTGPFEIRWDESDRDEVRASLHFVCESWDSVIGLPGAYDK